MNTQVKGWYRVRCVWMLVAMAGLSMPVQSSALADEIKKAGVDFVLEPTISEGKSKANVFGFLKDTVTSNAPISLDVRVFDPRTAALVSMVTVNSSEIKSEKVGLGDIQSVMGAVGGGEPTIIRRIQVRRTAWKRDAPDGEPARQSVGWRH